VGVAPVEIADVVGLPLAGVYRSESGLADALERGEPPAANGRGPLADLARELLTERGSRSSQVAVA
jgi:hypothetical protein